jgi:hypothetical protein
MCAPSLLILRAKRNPSVELIPVAPVWADEQANGRPVYFSDVVERADSNIDSFEGLRGRTWAYNDDRSLADGTARYNAFEMFHPARSSSRSPSSTSFSPETP